jgi:hypothetical protein
MRTFVRVASAFTALSFSAALLHAQAPLSGQIMQVTPYAGYLISGDILKGPLGTSLSTAGGPVYGAQVGLKVTPAVSLIGNFGYSKGDLRIGVPILGGYSVGNSTMLMYDGGVELTLPNAAASGLAFAPFLQLGAGAMRYEANTSVFSTKATNFAGNAGIGADVTLAPSMGLRLMVKDYIGKFDFKEATALDLSGETTHNWALSAGLRLAF